MKYLLLAVVVGLVGLCGGDVSGNERCSCKCPETYWVDPSIQSNFPERKIYINSTVKSNECDCEHVVQPVLNLTPEQTDHLCTRCQCKHETRSTITIKVVVLIILWILVVLIVYLFYLVVIEPFVRGKQGPQVRRASQAYQSQENDDSFDNDVAETNATPLRQYQGGGVVNRLGRETDRWKKQVEIQRSTVYDRHSMLN